MKRLTYLYLLIFCAHAAAAQYDFREGFVITYEGDTLHGAIDYKGNKSNARKCIFKPMGSTGPVTYTPEDIRAYRFTDGKYYVARQLPSDGGEKLLFIEFLIDGIVDVYYYLDEKGMHYLVEDESGRLMPLENPEIEVTYNGMKYRRRTNAHVGVLKHTFRESPSILRRVEKISLNHESLVNVTRDYHDEVCTDWSCVVFEKELPSKRPQFGLLLGVSAHKLMTYGEFSMEYYYLQNSDFSLSVSPTVGVYLNFNMPYINERLSYHSELTYTSWQATAQNLYVEPLYSLHYHNDLTLRQHALQYSGWVRYIRPGNKLRLVFQGGFFVTRFFKSDFERDLVVRWPWDSVHQENTSYNNPFGKLDGGAGIGVGLMRSTGSGRELSLLLRYQHGFGMFHNVNSQQLSLLFSMQLGKSFL